MQDTLLQTILGERYEILSLLGTGGLSRVYKARHLGMDSLVAIKILNRSIADDEQGAKRFQQEARLVSALDHPNIVKVQSVGIGPDSRPYLVLDYFPGKTLSALLKEQGALSTSSACPIFVQLARAVEHAHAAGILHRDLKPGNVLVSDTESGATVKVIDFGIGKFFGDDAAVNQSLTSTNQLLGTPAYMSPEQCKGQALDTRSDIYSFGCLMYEAMAGQPPFVAENPVEIMFQHTQNTPKKITAVRPQSTIPESLEQLILKCIEKEPSRRFQNMHDLLRSLEGVQSDSHTLTRKLIIAARRIAVAGESSKLIAALSVAVALVAVFGSFAIKDMLSSKVIVTQVDPQVASMVEEPESTPVEKIPAVRNAIENLATTDGKKADLLSRLSFSAKQSRNFDLLESLAGRASELTISQDRHAYGEYLDRYAEALYLNDKFNEAARTYKKSISLFDLSTNPRIESRLMLSRSRMSNLHYHAAERELKELCESLKPEADPGKLEEAYTQLAIACIGVKKYPEARRNLQIVLKYTPYPYIAEELIATSYLKEGKFGEAEALYKKLIKQGKFRHDPVYSMLGRLYWVTGKADLAEEYLLKALTENESSLRAAKSALSSSQIAYRLFLLKEIRKFANKTGRTSLEADMTAKLALINDSKVVPVGTELSW